MLCGCIETNNIAMILCWVLPFAAPPFYRKLNKIMLVVKGKDGRMTILPSQAVILVPHGSLG